MVSAGFPLKPRGSAHLPASSATLSATLGLEGRLMAIGLPFFEAKKRTRPVGSTASTAPQRGHLYFPTPGMSSVTRQRAQEACVGNAVALGAAAAGGAMCMGGC